VRVKKSPTLATRRGVSVVLISICLVSLVGMLAISLEGGLLLTERRKAQSTADAAAMAGATDLYYHHYVNYGVDAGGSAEQSALTTAYENSYKNDGVETKVEVFIPPRPNSGPYAGKASYVEVIVTYYHTRGFSAIFGANKVEVKARSVAVGKPAAAEVGILVLDPLAKSAFNAGGGAKITVNKVPVQVNSTSSEGSIAGGGGSATAPLFNLTGYYTTSGGGTFNGPIRSPAPPMPDPLRNLPVPDKSKLTTQSRNKKQYTSGSVELEPGVYVGGINASSTASITLKPGVYYMDSGGFSFTGQGSLRGDGVMIYTAPGNGNADGVDLAASGTVKMTPQTTGIYKGVLLYQDRTSTVAASVSGGSNMDLTGTFYFANAQLNVTGNSNFINVGSQYVSRTLNVQGTTTLYVDWNPDGVGQTRLITIVE